MSTGNGKTLANPLGTALTGSTYVPPSSNPAVIKTALQNQLNIMTGDSRRTTARTAAASTARKATPTARRRLNFGAYDKNNVLPYTINYTLNMQWQPTNDLAVTIGYTGNRGRHAVIPSLQRAGPSPHPANPDLG